MATRKRYKYVAILNKGTRKSKKCYADTLGQAMAKAFKGLSGREYGRLYVGVWNKNLNAYQQLHYADPSRTGWTEIVDQIRQDIQYLEPKDEKEQFRKDSALDALMFMYNGLCDQHYSPEKQSPVDVERTVAVWHVGQLLKIKSENSPKRTPLSVIDEYRRELVKKCFGYE